MKRLVYLLFLAVSVILSSCRETTQDPVFSVDCPSVFVGEDLVAHFAFVGFSGEMSINCFVFAYDANSGKVGDRIAGATFRGPDGKGLVMPCSFPVPASGKYDLYVGELPAGTYHLVFSSKNGNLSFVRTCIAVVKSNGVIIDPEPGETKRKVDDFTVPAGIDGGDFVMHVGEELVFEPEVSPAGLGDVVYLAESESPKILIAAGGTNAFSLTALSAGEAVVTVSVFNMDGPEKRFNVTVVSDGDDIDVDDFSVPSADALSGHVEMESGDDVVFVPEISVGSGDVQDVVFDVSSSDPDVAEGGYENGAFVFHPKKPGYCSLTISVANGNGPTKTIPVMVYCNVVIKVDFLELDTPEEQIQQKTFSCYLRFTSDSAYEFEHPVVFTVSAKAFVLATGFDSKTCTDKSEIKFFGNKTAYYNIYDKILLPASNLLPVDDYTLRVSISLQKQDSFDANLWRVTYNYVYLTQTDTMIYPYLTSDLQ